MLPKSALKLTNTQMANTYLYNDLIGHKDFHLAILKLNCMINDLVGLGVTYLSSVNHCPSTLVLKLHDTRRKMWRTMVDH
jgi:hypothetical protein